MKTLYPSNNRSGLRASAWGRRSHSQPIGLVVQSLLVLVWLAGTLVAPLALRAEISEPDTVFYGQIINRTSGDVFLVSTGTVTWVVSRPDGQQITLSGAIAPLRNSLFTYRLNVPHQALAAGLVLASDVVPLATQPATCSVLQILVNGAAARVLAPGSQVFHVAQSLRASTYRLDLEVFTPLADSDTSGLPDWWKQKYLMNDSLADPDGDGWNNLQEFLNGGNPTNDNRLPSLETKEMFAYADGVTVVRLHAVDSDSDPTNLTYTLQALPQRGALFLRNHLAAGSASDALLAAGDSFTQDDANKSRVIFRESGPTVTTAGTSFTVSLRDEMPAHPAFSGSVAISFYRPRNSTATPLLGSLAAGTAPVLPSLPEVSADEQIMAASYYLSRDLGFAINDASRAARSEILLTPSSGWSSNDYAGLYVPSFGRDRSHVLVGGTGDDRLVGGMEADILVGGRGNDHLRGNGGSDLFLIASRDDGNDTIEDFSLADHDVIDISRILDGPSPWVTNYVCITNAGTNSYLGINFNGDGTGFSNMVVTLWGVHFTQDDLRALIENGNLITGSKDFTPRVTITATLPLASENGPVAGEFTLTRSSSANAPLTVNLQITGSALNGVDYVYISSQVTFGAGARTVSLPVMPYVDAITELTEVVQVAVLPGSGYDVGTPATAQVGIEDLMPQITIEALDTTAVKADGTPAVLLISRAGVIDRSVLVRLNVSGTATRGVDYDGVPTFVNLLPNQTTALLTVTAKSAAVLSNGVELAQVTIRPDSTYRVMDPSSARIFIVDELMNLTLWRQRNFPGSSESLAAFEGADYGQTGIRNLFRYAFGLNPQNPRASSGQPAFQLKDNRLTVYFRQPASLTDVTYVVEVSDDLKTWHSTPDQVEQYFPPEHANEADTVCYRAKRAVTDTPGLYMRVRVVPQP